MWTDCVQAMLILMAPITVVAKVLFDSYNKNVVLRPISDFDVKESFLR